MAIFEPRFETSDPLIHLRSASIANQDRRTIFFFDSEQQTVAAYFIDFFSWYFLRFFLSFYAYFCCCDDGGIVVGVPDLPIKPAELANELPARRTTHGRPTNGWRSIHSPVVSFVDVHGVTATATVVSRSFAFNLPSLSAVYFLSVQ